MTSAAAVALAWPSGPALDAGGAAGYGLAMLVFGYGSLVHRGTHSHAPAARAELPGWRREWVHTALRPLAFLTALPDPAVTLDGLVLPVAAPDAAGLAARESAYGRAVALVRPAQAAEVTVFTIPPGRHPPADRAHPILLSYLHVVVAGYLAEFGADGVARFFATTRGWDAPIEDDRAAPRYPRAMPLTAEIAGITRAHLAARSVRIGP